MVPIGIDAISHCGNSRDNNNAPHCSLPEASLERYTQPTVLTNLRKQTLWPAAGASGLGHKETYAVQRKRTRLFDDLVGDSRERWRHLDAERLGGLEVDRQLEIGRQHDRQIAGLLA